MEYRALGRTGWNVSAVSFGAWAIGGTWGTVRGVDSLAALRRAVELGVNLFDTADVHGDGRSERLLARLRKECGQEIYIATRPAVGSARRRRVRSVGLELQPSTSDACRSVPSVCQWEPVNEFESSPLGGTSLRARCHRDVCGPRPQRTRTQRRSGSRRLVTDDAATPRRQAGRPVGAPAQGLTALLDLHKRLSCPHTSGGRLH